MRNLCHSRSEAHAFHTCAAPLSVFLICLSYRQCPIRPFGAPSPRGEGYDTRIPSSKKTARHPCEPIRSPASSSRAQPRDLSCAAVSIPHVLAGKRRLDASFYRLSLTHVLPVCKKDPSTSALMTRKKDGSSHILFIPLRRVVPLRDTLSCAFGAGRLASQEGALMGRLGASLD